MRLNAAAPAEGSNDVIGHPRTACVIGAGIGGLAAAVALVGQGWTVRVFERGGGPRTSGGGIGLTPNGLHALNRLGVGDRIRSVSVPQLAGGVRTPSGRWLARSDLTFVQRRYGEGIRALRRTELTAALAAALPAGTLRFGVDARLRWPGGPAELAVVDAAGESVSVALVVAADGIRSAARSVLYPDHPGLRHCGITSWRAVAPADGLAVVPAETWGAGHRFSVLPLPGGEVHFSALARIRDGRSGWGVPAEFARWHHPIPELLARVAAAELFRDGIEELVRPVAALTTGRVALVGDAGHPMTPNVGSANLALEDAVVLGHEVGSATAWPGLRAGLCHYDQQRRPRTSRLAVLSRRAGRAAELSGPGAVAVRNAAVRIGGLLPEAVSRRSLDLIAGWRPPGRD